MLCKEQTRKSRSGFWGGGGDRGSREMENGKRKWKWFVGSLEAVSTSECVDELLSQPGPSGKVESYNDEWQDTAIAHEAPHETRHGATRLLERAKG